MEYYNGIKVKFSENNGRKCLDYEMCSKKKASETNAMRDFFLTIDISRLGGKYRKQVSSLSFSSYFSFFTPALIDLNTLI